MSDIFALQDEITLAVVELAPDSTVPGHRHENEQLGMVITGRVTFTIGDETRQLGPGGTWRILSNRLHVARAGPDGAIVIDVFARRKLSSRRPAPAIRQTGNRSRYC